ncbi:MAG: glycosyltransferase family 2 protein [Candidatus Gastranaerophilales bacterium]|nr:glycosyltransferase family 2 protein [Candidatus Gastranaerophilales bacterium]
MKVLVLLAGNSKNFENQGYIFPKFLIEVDGKPLLQKVIENITTLSDSEFIFVIRKEESERYHYENIIKLLVPNAKVITVENITRGAACTALFAIDLINKDEPLIITNGDQYIHEDLDKAIKNFKDRDLDGGIITFDSVHPRWSYVRLDDENFVIETAEKRPISKYATAGFFYFKNGKDYVEAAKNMIRKDAQVDGLYYVCPTYNEMILNHAKIGVYQIDRDNYYSFSTAQGVESFAEDSKKLRTV